jgi:hypothetical protein
MTPEGEDEPKSGDAKARFAQILSAVVSGRSNEELRSVLNAAWRLAQDSKHSAKVTRAHALAAAHAAMLIARTLAELGELAMDLRPPVDASSGLVTASASVSFVWDDTWLEQGPPPEWDPSEWEPSPDWDPHDFEPDPDDFEPPDFDPPAPWEVEEPPDPF